jgi:hypothetical protein
VDLPIENGGSFHSYVNVYQRVGKLWTFHMELVGFSTSGCESQDLVLAECAAGDAGPDKNPEGPGEPWDEKIKITAEKRSNFRVSLELTWKTLLEFTNQYPLVNVYITMERATIING